MDHLNLVATDSDRFARLWAALEEAQTNRLAISGQRRTNWLAITAQLVRLGVIATQDEAGLTSDVVAALKAATLAKSKDEACDFVIRFVAISGLLARQGIAPADWLKRELSYTFKGSGPFAGNLHIQASDRLVRALSRCEIHVFAGTPHLSEDALEDGIRVEKRLDQDRVSAIYEIRPLPVGQGAQLEFAGAPEEQLLAVILADLGRVGPNALSEVELERLRRRWTASAPYEKASLVETDLEVCVAAGFLPQGRVSELLSRYRAVPTTSPETREEDLASDPSL